MEVISRRERQSITIGEQTHITVLKIYEDHVRLAISCPQHTPSFFEADVYVNDRDDQVTRQNWWTNTFRGVDRFSSLHREF